MPIATFESNGDEGMLHIKTYFDTEHVIICQKEPNETFRLGGTAVNEILSYEGMLLNYEKKGFRAFTSPAQYFDGEAVLSPEGWDDPSDRHCYITEYYDLEVEGKSPGWIISRRPLQDKPEAFQVFINLDVLDGGGNIIKRYRVSPFFGTYRVISHGIN
jgi:hypothetical protein